MQRKETLIITNASYYTSHPSNNQADIAWLPRPDKTGNIQSSMAIGKLTPRKKKI